ncbi:MAG: EAL domain-containing protein [Chromatiales bacterium]|nr:EAL domain-containing protein [Chromatiales bacterium]
MIKSRISQIVLTAILVACAFVLVKHPAIERLDYLLYDYFLNLLDNRISDELVVVAIDDSSLQAMGRWPWSRKVHAQLLDRLTALQARVVGFDVLFSEAETTDPLADKIFADAIARSGVTVLAVAPTNPLPGKPIAEVLPLPMLATSAAALGHVDFEIDSDGLCRSFYLYAGMDDARWPTFTLAMANVAGDQVSLSRANKSVNRETVSWLRSGRYLIPYDARKGGIETISAYQFLHNDQVAAKVEGRYVLVGSTATGLGDVISTPVSKSHQRMPGVLLNAHVLSGLLGGNLLQEMDQDVHLYLILVITGLVTFLLSSARFPASVVLFLVAVIGIPIGAGLVLSATQIWFAPAASMVPLLIGIPLWGVWLHRHEKSINRQLSVRMHDQATHHAVTGLPNQYALEEYLRKLNLADAPRANITALMIIHVKWLKSTGSIIGRSAGNQLLQAIAQLLRDVVRSDDIISHLGGDDFGVLVQGLNDVQSADVVAQNLLRVMQQPIAFEETSMFLAPCIGMSLWPESSEDGEALLRDAKIAVFRARMQGLESVCRYSPQIAREVEQGSQLEQALIFALERNEFEVYYQPQVVTETGQIFGVEALLRWHNPDLGLVYPSAFIPVAEHTGLIRNIGLWVLRTACQQVQQWNRQGLGPIQLAVNLSPLQFSDKNLVDGVRRCLEDSGLEPGYLELEITESAVMQNLTEATNAMRLLKEQGVKLAIDDFGTGYSSLSNLQHFPLDRIKIDQSFTREFQQNENVKEITLTIIQMAKRLKLKVIAEGVETEAQADHLQQYGCDGLQGYYYSHPVPASELTDILDAGESKQVNR